jgi:hypothetical protein
VEGVEQRGPQDNFEEADQGNGDYGGKSFGEKFCDATNVPLADFEKTFLRQTFQKRGRILALILSGLWPSLLQRENELMQSLKFANRKRTVYKLVGKYKSDRAKGSFFKRLLGLTVSGRKILRFEAAFKPDELTRNPGEPS